MPKLEIYKFVVPILLAMIGAILWFELNSIRDNSIKTADRMDTINNTVAGLSTQMLDMQQNFYYTRDRIDKMEGRHK